MTHEETDLGLLMKGISRGERFVYNRAGYTLSHNGCGYLLLKGPDRSQRSTTHAKTRPDLTETIVREFLGLSSEASERRLTS